MTFTGSFVASVVMSGLPLCLPREASKAIAGTVPAYGRQYQSRLKPANNSNVAVVSGVLAGLPELPAASSIEVMPEVSHSKRQALL